MNNSQIFLALFGCGPHAQRVYLPALKRLSAEFGVELSLVVDLYSKADTVQNALAKLGLRPETWFIQPFQGALPCTLATRLSSFVSRKVITGIVIATEPLAHKAYAEWALQQGLSILLDKPITTRENVTSDLSAADGIEQDYIELLRLYENAQTKRPTAFIVNAQRRFHPGFQLAEDLISEIGLKTNCPVTFVHSYHCDGQWRLPSEFVTQEYHPYRQGYGKASHSGYHIFDAATRLYLAAGTTEKFADRMEIVSSFIQPAGFLRQINETDYRNLLGPNYKDVSSWTDSELYGIMAKYGEIDLAVNVRLIQGMDAIANVSINLVHNGFSRRSWMRPGADLYKGNGRVKHEHHNIQQGPFQNIQIHSYQAKDSHDRGGPEEERLGGNNHFELHVFRNPLVTDNSQSLQVYRLSDIEARGKDEDGNSLIIERVKHKVVREFVEFLLGRRLIDSMRSRFEDHLVTVLLMSGVYRSHILRSISKNPIVNKDIPLTKWSKK